MRSSEVSWPSSEPANDQAGGKRQAVFFKELPNTRLNFATMVPLYGVCRAVVYGKVLFNNGTYMMQ